MTTGEVPALRPEHRSLVAGILAGRNIPGAAVGIVEGGQLSAFDGFGLADVEAKAKLTPDSLFRVASITKTVTATAILRLRDAGKLNLDDPLVLHLPEFTAARVRRGSLDQVTFRRMLAHRSGLMSDAPHDYWETHNFPAMDQILTELDRVAVVIEPDQASKYSNLAFALMGEVVARHEGREFSEHVRATILEPLGMTSSVFELHGDSRSRLATGYDARPFTVDVRIAPHPPLKGITAAGQLYSSVRDLARWIGFQLQIGPSSEAGPNVLAGSTLEEMHRPQFLDSDWRVGHCLAWLARRRGDEIHVGHEGSLPGYRSAHYFNKSTRSGVVVLTNRGWQNGAHDASLALLDAVVAEAHTQTSAGPHTSTEAMPSAYEPLLGIYAFHGIPDMRLVYRAGQLRIEAENPIDGSLHAPSALLPTADPLVFEVVEGRGAGELGHFRAVEGGEILAFALGAAVYWKMAEARD